MYVCMCVRMRMCTCVRVCVYVCVCMWVGGCCSFRRLPRWPSVCFCVSRATDLNVLWSAGYAIPQMCLQLVGQALGAAKPHLQTLHATRPALGNQFHQLRQTTAESARPLRFYLLHGAARNIAHEKRWRM